MQDLKVYRKELKKRIFRLTLKIKNVENKIKMMANNFMEDLLKINNDLEIMHERFSASKQFLVTENVFLLKGYIDQKDLEQLKELQLDPFMTLNYKEAKEGPTKLTEKKYFGRFSFFTELFGLPKYGMIDPTYIIAIFFPFFFGFMLSDMGYGFLLLLLSLFIQSKAKNIKQLADIGYVFTVCSLSTIFFWITIWKFLWKPTRNKSVITRPIPKKLSNINNSTSSRNITS
jgi:V/A-type H+-transporting ATPase subunit I